VTLVPEADVSPSTAEAAPVKIADEAVPAPQSTVAQTQEETPACASAPAVVPETKVDVPKQEEHEEAVDKSEDLDDPLAMLGGMGQEQVYQVTLVPEADVSPSTAEAAPANMAYVAAPAPPTVAQTQEAAPTSDSVEGPVEPAVLAGDGEMRRTFTPSEPETEVLMPEHPVEHEQPQQHVDDVGSDKGAATCSTGGSVDTPRSHSGSDTWHVSFVCDSTKPGDCLAIVGSDPAFGNWNLGKAVRLTTSGDSWPIWSGDVPAVAPGSEFKLVIASSGGNVSWEPIDGNRTWPSSLPSGTLATFGR
jgi:hypothetical protein